MSGLNIVRHTCLLYCVREASIADDLCATISVEIYMAAVGCWHLRQNWLMDFLKFLFGDYRLLSHSIYFPSMFARSIVPPRLQGPHLLSLTLRLPQ